MKKKIMCIFVCMLMFVAASAATATQLTDGQATPQYQTPSTNQNRDMWDVLFQFDAGGQTASLYLVGLGFDGTYFYCPTFNSATMYRFDIDGVYIDSITIPGVPNIIDLTYDGTYFYGQGQSPTNVIYQMDFTTQTLVGTIPTPHAAWNIAYDADHDGFWIGQWQTYLSLIDRSGNVLDTITPPDSMLGMAWDPWTSIEGYDGPFLWIFTGTSTGGQGVIKVIDLATKTLVPGIEHNVATELGMGIAGGLELTTDYQTGLAVLIGLIQGAGPPDDYAFGYELSTTGPVNQPPATPAAPNGPDDGIINIEYDFTAATSDPESNQIYYWFDWDDGTNSGWLGPYASGALATASHEWDTGGDYDITVKAKDDLGAESDVSPAHTITIVEGPILQVEGITGGLFKVKATITNTGASAASNIQWSITLTGGLVLLGKETTGNILSLDPGGSREISSKTIIGLGKTLVTVTATVPESSATEEQNATVLLFFIKI